GQGGMLTVGKVVVAPQLTSLLGTPKVLRSIEIEKLVLTQQAIDHIPLWTKTDPNQPAAVRVESVRLDDAIVKLDKASFGPLDARVSLNDAGNVETALVTTQDGKLKAQVKPEKGKLAINASAKSWKLPMGPALVFDELEIRGIATTGDVVFDDL